MIFQKWIKRIKHALGFYTDEERKHFIQIFRNNQTLQSKERFYLVCFNEYEINKVVVTEAIRNAIANLGNIESLYIHAEISFEELSLLKYWDCIGDAGFDTLIFINTIGLELGINFSDPKYKNMNFRDPDLHSYMKIYEFIREFYSWLVSHESQ